MVWIFKLVQKMAEEFLMWRVMTAQEVLEGYRIRKNNAKILPPPEFQQIYKDYEEVMEELRGMYDIKHLEKMYPVQIMALRFYKKYGIDGIATILGKSNVWVREAKQLGVGIKIRKGVTKNSKEKLKALWTS